VHADTLQPTYQQNSNMINPNTRMVALPTGIATIAAQKFTMPKDTVTYGVAGMTIFPYYEASPQLQSFLNSRVGGVPVTDLPITSNIPQTSLPPTDTIHLNIPMIDRRVQDPPSSTRMALKKQGADEVPWVMANQKMQTFAIPGDPNAVAVVSQGTMFNAAAPRTMALRCGTMWVITGQKPVAVLTKYGAIAVSPYSIAAIEQTWLNKVSTTPLYGRPIEVQLAHKGNTSRLTVERGKELCITESSVASAGTSDYADQTGDKQLIASSLPLSNVPPVPDLNVITRTLDPDSSAFLSDLKAITPPMTDLRMVSAYQNMFNEHGVSIAMRREAARRQFMQTDVAVNTTPKPSTYKASLDDRYFVPVYKPVKHSGPVIFPRSDEALKTLWVQHGAVKYLANSNVEAVRSGRLEFSSGEAMFVASEPMTVRANDCFVEIQDGAIAQIIANRELVVVRNLKEVGTNSVKLKIRNRLIECPAGSEIIVASTMPTIYAQIKSDGITRRNGRITELAGGSIMLNQSEIELTSLMQYDSSMRRLYESKDAYDQKLLGQIVKMDAVLTMVTKNRGSYQRMTGIPTGH